METTGSAAVSARRTTGTADVRIAVGADWVGVDSVAEGQKCPTIAINKQI
jgi:hypothetical protein